MIFWKSKYNNFIYEIEYENLINKNENEIKEIIKFCDFCAFPLAEGPMNLSVCWPLIRRLRFTHRKVSSLSEKGI